MTVAAPLGSPWLLLAFNLPSKHASARVEIWSKIRKSGALALRTSGYLLPNQPENQERFEWLSVIIRKYKGEATIVQVSSFDDLPHERLAQMFLAARNKDYQQLINMLKRKNKPDPRQFSGLRRLQEIAAIDFFQSTATNL